MRKNKTFFNRALQAMLLAGFAVVMSPTSVHAADVVSNTHQSSAQQNQIKGSVIDEFGEPMIGVTIKVKGGSAAAITDLDGNFSISVPAGSTLEFSYVGYNTETVKASNGMKVQLKPDTQQMDEVVVIGFGTVKKRDLTGAVASVKAEALVQAPTSDVATALQGRITGLDVSGGELRIRGNRSINGKNEPLVIIDGVQGGSMSDINPQDVESIDVLKDASSTAIYGSQGANGVIIITTKKAEQGRMNISYNGAVTAAFRADHPEYRHGDNYYETVKLAAQNAGMWNSTADDRSLFSSDEAFAAYKAGVWTNYEDLLQKSTTWSTHHTVTLAGGTDKTSARFSLGYASNGNRWKESTAADRYTLRANIDHSLYKWVSAGVNFQLTHNRASASPYERATTTKYELGSPYGYLDGENYVIGNTLVERPLASDEYVNPLIDGAGNYLFSNEHYSTNVVANAYVDIHPIKGLTFKSQFNSHITNSSSGSYTDGQSAANLDKTGQKSSATMTKASGLYMEWNNILTYNFTQLPEDHHLGVTLLTSWGKSIHDNLSATSKGQTLASNLWWNLASNDGLDGSSIHSSGYTQSQTLSYAGRISYDYMSKYLFTASIRRDGASRLAEGHKWDTFPSAALAWRVTDEAWMKSVKGKWLDDLKLRATYGVTGNSGIGVYGTKSGITFANWAFGFQDTAANRYILGTQDNNGSGYYVVANTDTKWEKSTTFDLGFDAFLFNSRINIVFDWYNTRTNDLILLRSLPTSSGMDGKYATYTNIGATNNRGVEFTITSRNIDKKHFKWNSTLSFSANKEKIVDLIEGKDITIGTEKETGTLMIGHPIKSFNTFEYGGIWSTSQADEAAIFSQKPGDIHVIIPGMYQVEPGVYSKGELDEEGKLIKYTKENPYTISQSDDIGYVGSRSPKWFAGFNNDFKIGDFDVNLYLYARWGQWATNRMANYDPSNGGQYDNMDFWVAGSNENALLPGAYKGRKFFDYTGYQSIWYADNSFIKLKRVSVGYTLPRQILKTIGVSNVRVYATVNDPLYFVKSDFQKGYDPEDNQRSLTFGLNVNF